MIKGKPPNCFITNLINILSFDMIRSYLIVIFILGINSIYAQSNQHDKMQKLKFLIGSWEGTSSSINNNISKTVKANQNIKFGLDQHIIIIDLHSETLDLHTIIYFDEMQNKYSYNPFYKNGSGKYSAELIDDKLIVMPNDSKKFVFQLKANDGLQEYGEKLEDGEWIRYFEDNFERIKEN